MSMSSRKDVTGGGQGTSGSNSFGSVPCRTMLQGSSMCRSHAVHAGPALDALERGRARLPWKPQCSPCIHLGCTHPSCTILYRPRGPSHMPSSSLPRLGMAWDAIICSHSAWCLCMICQGRCAHAGPDLESSECANVIHPQLLVCLQGSLWPCTGVLTE